MKMNLKAAAIVASAVAALTISTSAYAVKFVTLEAWGWSCAATTPESRNCYAIAGRFCRTNGYRGATRFDLVRIKPPVGEFRRIVCFR
jgi:hypothetical protein